MYAKENLWEKLKISTEIIVIDNHSADAAKMDELKTIDPSLQIIRNSDNLGFAKANNFGISLAKGDFILFLNPDTLVPSNVLVSCIQPLLENKKIGAVGVRMIDGKGEFLAESKRGYPGWWASLMKLSGLYKLNPQSNFFNSYYAPHVNEKSRGKVDVLSGAFFLSRREILDKVGGFDDRYFMYGEDIDLSIQIKKAGYENWYFGDQTIIHYKGESTEKNEKYIQRFYGAMKLFLEKYHPIQAKLFGGLIDFIIKRKRNQLPLAVAEKEDLTKYPIFEILDEKTFPIEQAFDESVVYVWEIHRSENISELVDYLEQRYKHRLGIKMTNSPYIIEVVSNKHRSGFFRVNL